MNTVPQPRASNIVGGAGIQPPNNGLRPLLNTILRIAGVGGILPPPAPPVPGVSITFFNPLPVGLKVGDMVTISKTLNFNGTWPISNIVAPTNVIGITGPTALAIEQVGSAQFDTVQVTTVSPTTAQPGSYQTISGAANSAYDGNWQVRSGGNNVSSFTVRVVGASRLNPSGSGTFGGTPAGPPPVVGTPTPAFAINATEISTVNSGIVGLLSPVPEMIQFTNRMILALGNGYAPQYYADSTGTPVNPATTFPITITGANSGAGGVGIFFYAGVPVQTPPILLNPGTSFLLSNASPASTSYFNGVGQVLTAPSGPTNTFTGWMFSPPIPGTPPPVITGLSPSSGVVGRSVSVTGANFGATQGSSTITFNGVAATVTSWTDTTIVATVPATATTGPVVVTVGGNISNSMVFTVTTGTPLPSITSLSATSGMVGSSVTINGINFDSSGTVTFNGVAAITTSWTGTAIVTTVPAGATTGPVIVSTAAGASNQVTFTVTGVAPTGPAISSLNPISGPVGTSVTITGSNFGASQGSSTVTFGGIAATPTSWSAASIVVPVPSGATTGNVVVTVNSVGSNAVSFTVSSGATGQIISLASINGNVIVPAPSTYAGQQGISFSLQSPWPAGIGLKVGDTVTVSGTGSYDGSYTIAGLSPGPDPYGMTLLAGGNANTNIVLNQGQVRFPVIGRMAIPTSPGKAALGAVPKTTIATATLTVTAAPIYNNFDVRLPVWEAGISVSVGDIYVPKTQPPSLCAGGTAAGTGTGGVYIRCTQAGITVAEPTGGWPDPCNTQPTPGLFPITGINDPGPAVVSTPPAVTVPSSGPPMWEEVGWLNQLNPAPPGAAHVEVYSSCLFFFNTYPFQTGNANTGWGIDGPTSLRQSDVDNPFSWNPANQAFLDKDDGSEGMGLGTWTIAAVGIPPIGSMFAFKNYASYQVTGLFGAGIQISRIRTERGCTAPRTIQFLPGLGIARLTHLGISITDGVSDQLISDPVRPYLLFTNDRTLNDIIFMDSVWAPLSYAALSSSPPMLHVCVPIGVQGGSSGGALTRAFSYDLMQQSWAVIDFPFPISTIVQVLLVPQPAITLLGGFSDGLIQRWQFGDQLWMTGSAESSPVNWSYRTPVTASQNPDQRLFVQEISVKGVAAQQIGPMTATVTIDGVPYTNLSQAVQLQSRGGNGLDFLAVIPVQVTGQRFYADISGSGEVEIDSDNFHVSAKPIGGRLVIA